MRRRAEADATGAAARQSPSARAATVGIVAVHVVLSLAVFDPKPFVGGDNAGYMILAESIRSGDGYRDLYLPETPRHVRYPPVYPLILAAAGALGGRLATFKALSLALTAGTVGIFYALARRSLGPWGGLGVGAALAVNPVLLEYSHWELSEAPFVFLTALALFLTDQWPGKGRAWVWGLTAALGAYFTRSAGLPLVAAILIALGARRSWAPLGWGAGAFVLLATAWWSWGQSAPHQTTYGAPFLLVNPYQPELGTIGPASFLQRVATNARIYTTSILPESLAGVSNSGGAAMLAGLGVAGLALVGWARRVRQGRALEIFSAAYVVLLLAWPEVWSDKRFLLPLIPAILLHSAEGLRGIFPRAGGRERQWVLPSFGALIAVVALPGLARAIPANLDCLRSYRAGDRYACYPDAWREFFQAAAWARDSTPANATIVSRNPRLFYWVTHRRGDIYPFSQDPAQVIGFLDRIGVDYVVVDRLSATTDRYLVPAIRAYVKRFGLAYQVGASPTVVLTYMRPRGVP